MARRRSWCEAPAVPLRRERPFARSERTDLKRLGELSDVQAQAYGRVVASALAQRVDGNHRPRCDAREQVLDLVERRELLAQQPGGHPVLLRQRRIADAILDRLCDELLVKPIPARPRQLELENEIQRYALLQRFFEGGVEREVELRVQHV